MQENYFFLKNDFIKKYNGKHFTSKQTFKLGEVWPYVASIVP
jgi:hypothetical protein